MRASTPRKRTANKWRVSSADPAKMGPVLRECGFVADEADPLEVRVHHDAAGRLRRLHATYPSGWRATLTRRADDTFSLSQAVRLVSLKRDL